MTRPDTPVQALVFDFDGTIIDTETPIFESWKAAFDAAGADFVSLDQWRKTIGLAAGQAFDCRAHLCAQLGVDRVPDEIETVLFDERAKMLERQPVRGGVTEWIAAAEESGIPLAIASSSPTEWVDANLQRVGLRGRFRILSCADPGIPGKPDPAVYLGACTELGAEPSASIAIEDSPNGTAAAIAAGMTCLAVPGPITSGLDFSQATAEAASLTDVDPAVWLAGAHGSVSPADPAGPVDGSLSAS